MFRVTKELAFCYGHRLVNYDGKCRFLHGHNGRAVITVEGEQLDDRGMLTDFGDIKRTLGRWIDDNLDHRMVLHREDPLVDVLRSHGQPVLVLPTNPTAENLAKTLFDVGVEAGFRVVEVQFWETASSCAVFGSPLLAEDRCEHANGVYKRISEKAR
jgi:6-pyruvoyltetrahydropterin/6-carboxytetrahydropterin synthase